MKKNQREKLHPQTRKDFFIIIVILFCNLSVFFPSSYWPYFYSVEWRILYLWAVSSLSQAWNCCFRMALKKPFSSW